jgi:hypothetical protein
MGGPSAPLRWRKLLPPWLRDCFYQTTDEWKDQVDDLVIAVEALTWRERTMLWWKMLGILFPDRFQRGTLSERSFMELGYMMFGW